MKRLLALVLLLASCTSSLPENFKYEGNLSGHLPFEYSFLYPSNYDLREDLGENGETVSMELDGTLQWQFVARPIEAADISTTFMDQEATGTVQVDGMKAQTFTFPEGLCNGENCSPPAFVTQYMKVEDTRMQKFIIVDFTSAELTEGMQALLDSVESAPIAL